MPVFSIQPSQVLIGALLALLAAVAAYRVKLLTLSGGAAAFILGTVVYGLGGWSWAVVLITFFLSSSLSSMWFKRKKQVIEIEYDKGGTRDAGQVLANGGIAGLFVLLHVVLPTSPLPWIGFCTALAGAAADTWATEWGVLNRKKPLLLFSWKPVEAGTSGAVSAAGIFAAFSGSMLIAALAIWLRPAGIVLSPTIPAVFSGITLAGAAGSLIDSALGATLQAIYFCPACSKETERHPRHHCGTTTAYKRGLRWLNNDLVNLVCTLCASLLAIAFFGL